MNGVTILDTIEIYALSWWQFVLGFTPLIIAVIISIVCMCITYKKEAKEIQEQGTITTSRHGPKEIFITILGGILSLVLLMYLAKCCPVDYSETRYKVSVDKTTSFIEFHDKYNIIEEYPDYFIVTEKSK